MTMICNCLRPRISELSPQPFSLPNGTCQESPPNTVSLSKSWFLACRRRAVMDPKIRNLQCLPTPVTASLSNSLLCIQHHDQTATWLGIVLIFINIKPLSPLHPSEGESPTGHAYPYLGFKSQHILISCFLKGTTASPCVQMHLLCRDLSHAVSVRHNLRAHDGFSIHLENSR